MISDVRKYEKYVQKYETLLYRYETLLYRYTCLRWIKLFVAVEDWDLFERLMDYVYDKQVKSSPDLHPVLMSEPAVSLFFLMLTSFVLLLF